MSTNLCKKGSCSSNFRTNISFISWDWGGGGWSLVIKICGWCPFLERSFPLPKGIPGFARAYLCQFNLNYGILVTDVALLQMAENFISCPPEGGARDGSKFFQFHVVFGKICQNRILAPHLGEILNPPLLSEALCSKPSKQKKKIDRMKSVKNP